MQQQPAAQSARSKDVLIEHRLSAESALVVVVSPEEVEFRRALFSGLASGDVDEDRPDAQRRQLRPPVLRKIAEQAQMEVRHRRAPVCVAAAARRGSRSPAPGQRGGRSSRSTPRRSGTVADVVTTHDGKPRKEALCTAS